jgi:hypothetical protein
VKDDSRDISGSVNKRRKYLILILLIFFTAGLSSTLVLIKKHREYKHEVIESARGRLVSLTSKAAASIDGILQETIDNANSIAGGLTSGELTDGAALKELRSSLERREHLFNAALSYAPYAYSPDERLHAVLYVKKDGRIDNVRIDRIYDYTGSKYKWFAEALAKGPYWSQPFYAEASQALLVTYSMPFYALQPDGKRVARGVVTFSISMEEIKRIIESLDLGSTGFGALVSQKGVYIYHPDTDLVISGKTLREAALELGDKDRMILAEKAEKRESGILDHQSATTGLNAWMIYTPVPSTGWSLQNTFIKDDLDLDVDLMRRRLIWISVSLIILLSSACMLLLQVHRGGNRRLWAASSVCSLFLIVGIGCIWKISLAHDSGNRIDGMRISDRATLLRVMNSYTDASSKRHTEAPVFIPTGIYLETASLNASGELSLSGYLWQKYKVGAQDSLSRGFTIGNASKLKSEENYRIVENGFEVVRWHFTCTVPQDIDHSRYPLDMAKLDIRVLHRELDHNVFLVPDLAAYKLISPASLPGLQKGFALSGWRLSGSRFELRKTGYDTNFGLDRPIDKENFPSFHFIMVIKRIFLDAFISNLTALIIVFVLLFTLLMITSRDEKLVSFMQAGSGRILNICASMFFVIAFSHVDIRRRISSEQIFYLEYFYFIIYLAILLVSINSVIYSMGLDIPLIQYRKNLIFKVLFWPFSLGLIFTITILTFY